MIGHGNQDRQKHIHPTEKEKAFWARVAFANWKYHKWYTVPCSWGGNRWVTLCGKSLHGGNLQSRVDDNPRYCERCRQIDHSMFQKRTDYE